MLSEALLFVITFLLILSIFIAKTSKKHKHLPPGPIRWPLIGNIIEIILASPQYPHIAMANLAKKYGEIMFLMNGSHPTVVLSSFKAMKELLSKDEFIERFLFPGMSDRNFKIYRPLGIIWGYGPEWKEIRRYTIRGLREFGFNKRSSLESHAQAEVDHMISFISKKAQANGGILKINDQHDFSASAINILWSMVAGYRFPVDNAKFKRLLKLNEQQLEAIGVTSIYNSYPTLRHWFPNLTGHAKHLKIHEEVREVMKEFVVNIQDEHILSNGETPNNFIKIFLDKIESTKSDGSSSYYTEEQLVLVLMDLFLGGSETTGTSMVWTILFLALNPNVQKRIQREISDNVGIDESISFTHLERMVFTKATIYEIQRCAHFAPLVAPRMATMDHQYQNYIIPKGTCVMWNMYPVCMDKDFWGDPENFRPERYLDESETKLNSLLTERVSVFGFGKRVCVGQNLALDSIFLYMTNMLRKFTFDVIPGQEPSAERPFSTVTLVPRPYVVKVRLN